MHLSLSLSPKPRYFSLLFPSPALILHCAHLSSWPGLTSTLKYSAGISSAMWSNHSSLLLLSPLFSLHLRSCSWFFCFPSNPKKVLPASHFRSQTSSSPSFGQAVPISPCVLWPLQLSFCLIVRVHLMDLAHSLEEKL